MKHYCSSNFRGVFEGRSHGEQNVENGTYCVARGTIGWSHVVLDQTYYYLVRCGHKDHLKLLAVVIMVK